MLSNHISLSGQCWFCYKQPQGFVLRTFMGNITDIVILCLFGGHSSSENATSCMELVLWKVKDLKGKKKSL